MKEKVVAETAIEGLLGLNSYAPISATAIPSPLPFIGRGFPSISDSGNPPMGELVPASIQGESGIRW
ncbi:hypothetical protein ES703_102196 [subsurface metagenome]